MGEKGRLTHDSEGKTNDSSRGTWQGQFEFTLTLVGYSVGLGNIWRFPYLCYKNGGGAFIIPYVLFMLVCGFPLLYMEICIGQFSGKSPVHVWAISPLFKGLGLIMVTLSAVYCWYGSLLMAWVYYFLLQSFYPKLGWSTCNNAWNTPNCIEIFEGSESYNLGKQESEGANRSSTLNILGSNSGMNINLTNITGGAKFDVTNTNHTRVNTAATEFWENNVLGLSSGIDDLGVIQWHLLACNTFGWIVVFFCLMKGVKTVGKVVYVTVITPYALLTVLFIRGITLNGSWDGLKLYLNPDFTKLREFQIWQDAAVQVFYSLGPAWGGVITMASFNKFQQNAHRDALIVCFADAFTAIYAGLPVFAILGYMAKESGKPLDYFKASGPGLVFIAYPEALSQLPLPQVWSVLFFLMLVFVGIDSTFITFETISATVVDMYFKQLHKRKTTVVGVVIVIYCLSSVPLTTSGGYYILMLLDWYIATFNVVITALVESIVVAWIYGAGRFSEDIYLMIGRRPPLLLRCVWVFWVPLFTGAIALLACASFSAPNYGKGGYVFPDYAVGIGNVIAFLPLCILPIAAIVQIVQQSGNFTKRLKSLVKPSSDWEPNDQMAKELFRQKQYVYEKGFISRLRKNILGLNQPVLLNEETLPMNTCE